jgi:hypothetical protein
MDIRKEFAADIARIRSVAHYRGFGFLPARQFGIRNEYTEGDEFMIAVLVSGHAGRCDGGVSAGVCRPRETIKVTFKELLSADGPMKEFLSGEDKKSGACFPFFPAVCSS